MTSKIDVGDIFLEHLKTLRDAATGKLSVGDISVFFGLPFIIGLLGIWQPPTLDASAVAVIVSALAVFAGLLINVLVLLYTVKEVGPTEDESDNQIELIKQVNANLMFSILITLIAIVLICLLPFLSGIAYRLLAGLSACLVSNFLLTLLMSLKRINTLLSLRFK